jgi:hypothetical protein
MLRSNYNTRHACSVGEISMSSALTTLQLARPGNRAPRSPGDGQQRLYFNEYSATPWSQVPAATAPIEPVFALPADSFSFSPFQEDPFAGGSTVFSLVADAFRHSSGPAIKRRSPEYVIGRTIIQTWLASTGYIQKNPAGRASDNVRLPVMRVRQGAGQHADGQILCFWYRLSFRRS